MVILTAHDVASYFALKQATAESVEPLTNLKVQKLCYYAQGFALIKLERPLFHENIEHWQHGPVIPDLWKKYSRYKSDPIPIPDQPLDSQLFDREICSVLDNVNTVYGALSAWQLRNMTHAESPWVETPEGAPITYPKMRAYFGPLILGYDAGQSLIAAMSDAPEFLEMTKRGMDDIEAGRSKSLNEVRRVLADL